MADASLVHLCPPHPHPAEPPLDVTPLFEGVFVGGFEASYHRLEDGTRLDMLRSTRHDELAARDYARLAKMGMTACRDGVRWTLVEKVPGQFDFSAVLPMFEAARAQRTQVIWDLMHFGWPDHLDVFSTSFPDAFARYARAFAMFLRSQGETRPMLTPINEMSFLAWAGGDVKVMNPFCQARGVEMKVQMVRATIAAMDAVRDVLPLARFLQPEPVINIIPDEKLPKTWRRVESDHLLQYQAWDMLRGDVWALLGGSPRYLDVIGVNFYPDNQFMLDGTTVRRGEARYKPFSRMLLDVWERYRRPMIVSETGCEGDERAEWLRYVVTECLTAMEQGVQLHGITLYPVLNHPGWVDGRHIHNGLWDYAGDDGERAIYAPLAQEMLRAAPLLAEQRARVLGDARLSLRSA